MNIFPQLLLTSILWKTKTIIHHECIITCQIRLHFLMDAFSQLEPMNISSLFNSPLRITNVKNCNMCINLINPECIITCLTRLPLLVNAFPQLKLHLELKNHNFGMTNNNPECIIICLIRLHSPKCFYID